MHPQRVAIKRMKWSWNRLNNQWGGGGEYMYPLLWHVVHNNLIKINRGSYKNSTSTLLDAFVLYWTHMHVYLDIVEFYFERKKSWIYGHNFSCLLNKDLSSKNTQNKAGMKQHRNSISVTIDYGSSGIFGHSNNGHLHYFNVLLFSTFGM